jgi:hypothetical protein
LLGAPEVQARALAIVDDPRDIKLALDELFPAKLYPHTQHSTVKSPVNLSFASDVNGISIDGASPTLPQ